jgi:transposase-like protein
LPNRTKFGLYPTVLSQTFLTFAGLGDAAVILRQRWRTIGTNGVPDRVVIDKSGANLAGLQSVNVILKFTGSGNTIKILQVKYLNNIIAS